MSFIVLYVCYVITVVYQSRFDCKLNTEQSEKAKKLIIEMKEGINIENYMQVVDVLPPIFEDQQVGFLNNDEQF